MPSLTPGSNTAAPPPVPLAIVGLQFGAVVLDRLLGGPDASRYVLLGVCDLDPEKAAAAVAKYGVPAYAELEAVLADPRVRVIGLFTPPAGRAALLRRIVSAGKDVMTTKPFETDPLAAREVLELATARGRTICLNSPEPQPPPYLQQALAWQRQFALGRPVACRAETMVAYQETADGRWLDDPQRCPVAPIFRLGIYLINDLVRVFGRVAEVQVLATRLRTGRPTADNAQLNLRFENGALGSIGANFCVDNGQHYAGALWLHYEHGTITRNVAPVDYGEAEHSSRLQLTATTPARTLEQRTWVAPQPSGRYPWTYLADAVSGARALPIPTEQIVHGIEIIAAMARADLTGCKEPVRA